MAIALLLTGALLLTAGSALLCADSKPDAPHEKTPEANDKRIVKNPDGTYSIEYYWPYPAWQKFGGRSVATLDEAKQWLAALETKTPEAVVIETK